MLRRIRISRFKSIYSDELSFGYINLFIGPNGSGKSNVLEAIAILAAIFSRGLDPSELDLKGIRLSLPHIFKSAFKGHVLPKTFRIEATFDNGRYDCGIRASPSSSNLEFFSEALYDGDRQVYGRSMHGIKIRAPELRSVGFERLTLEDTRSVWSVVGPVVKISDAFREELDQFSRFAIYAPQTAVMRGLAIDSRVVEPLGLTGGGLASAFEAALLTSRTGKFDDLIRIIWRPGWADQVQVGGFNSSIVPSHVKSEGSLLYIRDRYMRGGRNYLSAFDASEGTLYLLFVGTLLAHTGAPNVFALDNVDGTLNPNLVRSLTNHIVSVCRSAYDDQEPRQVFLTSHHPSSLDSIDIFDKMQKIFICSRLSPEAAGKTSTSTAVGSTTFREFRPPSGMSKEDWQVKHGGKNLSELLLENRIKDALG